MTKELAPVHYESPAEDINGILDNYAWQINRSYGAGVKSLMEVGKILLAARDKLNNKQKFKEWVEKWFPFSVSSAYQYVVNYQSFGSSPESGLIEPSAQTALANNPIAKKQALKIAANGKPVSLSLANKLIEKNTPKTSRIESPKPVSVVEDAEFTVVTTATESPQEDSPQAPAPPKKGKAHPGDVPCPNCANRRYVEGVDHWACTKCGHYFGESRGDPDEEDVVDERITTKKAKTRKTIEALMREFDDLGVLVPNPKEHAEAISMCKIMLNKLKSWN